jgi:Tn7-like transposition protein D/TniQ
VICNFPVPYPDEILYSIFARYSDRMRYSSAQAVIQDLWGYKGKTVSVSFPNGLGRLINNLPPKHIHTVDSLIDNHTLLPFYEPFLPTSRIAQLRSTMEASKVNSVPSVMGLRTGQFSTECTRFCPCCVEEDRKQFSECYWHRVHQIPGIEYCPSHKMYLQTCNIPAKETRNGNRYLSAERMIDKNLPVFSEELNMYRDDLWKLALDAFWLLKNHTTTAHLATIQKKYLSLLNDRGLATYGGNIYISKLMQAFQQYYDSTFLKSLHCELNESVQDNWILRLPHYSQIVYHPIRHLLLIHFLGHSVETFLNLPSEQKPFGNGLWPCLNPICDHYRERCIQESEVIYTSSSKHGKPKAIFSCNCGFTYSRIGPDPLEETLFQASRIQQFGPIWEARLRELWEDPTITITQTARALGVNRITVKRQAKKMGLQFPQNLNKTALPQAPQNNFNTCPTQTSDPGPLEKYRTIWLSTREKYPEDKVVQLKCKIHTAYKWLYAHDREWLRSHYPTYKSSHFAFRNWEQADEQIAIEVRSWASHIKSTSVKPIWITSTSILKNTNQLSSIRANLHKLPLTAQALAEVTETHEAFVIRRIHWLVECYRQEQVVPTRRQFIMRGHFYLAHERWTSVQIAITDALSQLSAN